MNTASFHTLQNQQATSNIISTRYSQSLYRLLFIRYLQIKKYRYDISEYSGTDSNAHQIIILYILLHY